MDDLIRRSDVLSKAYTKTDYNPETFEEVELEVVDVEDINSIPAVDAVEVVRGKWNHDGSNWKNRFICDQCGYKWFFEAEEANFCPNCGTDMREENNG